MQTQLAAKTTLPSRSLFDPRNPMPWVPAVKTDIRATFARVQQQMKRGVK